ncbi:MAG: hypothetical protein ACYTFZ_10945, partial [Planctomycetota bacterium]
APEALAAEQEALRRVAQRVARSPNLALDIFTLADSDTKRIERQLIDTPSPRVQVSFGATWCLTRPTDHDASNTFAKVRDAVLPFWTFYAGRLLSPALAAVLAPYRYLDHLHVDPAEVPCPAPSLRPFYDVAQANWREHRLPTLPGLAFSVVPLVGDVGPRIASAPHDVYLRGTMHFVAPENLARLELGSPARMKAIIDHKGATLQCDVDLPANASALAFVPRLQGASPRTDEFFEHGLVAVRLPKGLSGGIWLHTVIRVQSAQTAAGQPPGVVRLRGAADLAYLKRPR